MAYRADKPAPDIGFQGEGILAVAHQDGGEAIVWSAPDPREDVPSIRASLRRGSLVVSADGPVSEQRFPTLDVQGALAKVADGLAQRVGAASRRSLPPAWCSWYQYGEHVTAAHVLRASEEARSLDLPLEIVQVDDGYQLEVGEWLRPCPDFGQGIAELVATLRESGRTVGLWCAPLVAPEHGELLGKHPDWAVAETDAGVAWGRRLLALDVTHPGVAEYLDRTFRTMSSWGVSYWKLDFLYGGALAGQRSDDESPLAAYRRAIRLIREAVGEEASLVGCGAPILPSLGLFDAMRIGPDIDLGYTPRDDDITMPSQLGAANAVRARAFQHGRFWTNDPDCLLLRPQMDRRQEWAQLVGNSRGLRCLGDAPDRLDSWGLEAARRLLQPSIPAVADPG
ncbi:MAG: glycoside hydrolase family 36 protein [Candidatus Dormibacteria bacterium]